MSKVKSIEGDNMAKEIMDALYSSSKDQYEEKDCDDLAHFPKRKSRISQKIESQLKEPGTIDSTIIIDKDSFNDEEDEIYKTEEEEEGEEESKKQKTKFRNDEEKNAWKNFVVYFYIFVNKRDRIFPIESSYFDIENQNVSELIEDITKKINEKQISIDINNRKYNIVLKENYEDEENFYVENYEIRPLDIKKNKPNFNLKSYSPNLKLINILNQNSNNLKICFSTKNNMDILLREKIFEESEMNFNKFEKESNNQCCSMKKFFCVIM